jgi:small-conductance mechanosensitive channel
VLVEFDHAGASSLDVAIFALFSGEAAPSYYKMRRLLNRLAVEACNRHGWTIPFTQLTVHQAKD